MAVNITFNPIYLKSNQGHGNARKLSLHNCSYDLVALMDADDISSPLRFEKQLRRFVRNPKLDIVGGQISEFVGSPNNITGIRNVPLKNDEIKKYMKWRCPMNQVSVMFKKKSIENVGGYLDWFCEEDYYLWIRMAEAGCVFENISDVLVNVRVGKEMSARRGGRRYFISEAKLQHYMLDKHIISFPIYIFNIAIRFGGELILPTSIRSKVYKIMRKQYIPKTKVKSQKKSSKKRKIPKSKYPKFSVAMCVYGGDNAEWFDTALESIVKQTIPPDEIVLVVDGSIPKKIQKVIDKYIMLCGGNISDENKENEIIGTRLSD